MTEGEGPEDEEFPDEEVVYCRYCGCGFCESEIDGDVCDSCDAAADAQGYGRGGHL